MFHISGHQGNQTKMKGLRPIAHSIDLSLDENKGEPEFTFEYRIKFLNEDSKVVLVNQLDDL